MLLLVGGAFTAGITNYLIPSITRQWQNHDKELEIKSALVKEMSGAAYRFFESIRSIELKSGARTLAPLDRAYVQWRTSTQVVAAEIDTYFPEQTIEQDWGNVDNTVVLTYTIFKTSSAQGRLNLMTENPSLLDHKVFRNVVATRLEKVDVNQEWYRYDADVGELEAIVGERVHRVTDEILNAHSSL